MLSRELFKLLSELIESESELESEILCDIFDLYELPELQLFYLRRGEFSFAVCYFIILSTCYPLLGVRTTFRRWLCYGVLKATFTFFADKRLWLNRLRGAKSTESLELTERLVGVLHSSKVSSEFLSLVDVVQHAEIYEKWAS